MLFSGCLLSASAAALQCQCYLHLTSLSCICLVATPCVQSASAISPTPLSKAPIPKVGSRAAQCMAPVWKAGAF